MDFEILSEQTRRPSLFDVFERYLTNRKLALQSWVKNPPHALGWGIFLLVALELVAGNRLLKQTGIGSDAVRQFIALGGTILIVEFLLAVVAAQAAEIFKTTGATFNLITLFNIGLSPLLLLLPVTLLTWLSGAAEGARFFLVILFLVKVVGNWRESLELVYKFTRMQSALVLYAASAIGIFVLLLAGYALLFNKLAHVL